MTQLTHIQPADLGEADQALKTKHRAVWASGNYANVVDDLVHELGPILVEAAGIKPGDLVLDIAAGTGNAAIPAAQTGARVIASDLTPELMSARSGPLRWVSSWPGKPPTPRLCRTATVFSMLSCPAWESCSRRTTRLPRTNWSASAARAARSV